MTASGHVRFWVAGGSGGGVSARLGGGRVASGCGGGVSEAATYLLDLEAAGSPVAVAAE
jgi:hypothetical protein